MMRKTVTAAMALMALAACSPHKTAGDDASAQASASDMPASAAPSGAAASTAAIDTSSRVLDCTHPLSGRMTAAQVQAGFGAQAVAADDIEGAEGGKLSGVVLNRADYGNRLDIVWWDKARTAVSMVRAFDDGYKWTAPGGVHVRMSLADLQAANGKPFKFYGFGWDSGGQVVDWMGGNLAKVDGGCSLAVTLSLPGKSVGETPESIMGEHELMSDDAALKDVDASVFEVTLGWPLPDGVKGDAQGDAAD